MKSKLALLFIFVFMALVIWQCFKPVDSLSNSARSIATKRQIKMHMPVDIDGHLPTPPERLETKDAWQTENLRALLDFYIAYYEQSEQKMWQEFNQYCHPLIYCVELTELFQRYLLYKRQLQHLDTEHLDLALEFENRLDKLEVLRSKLFSAHEISMLFGNEEAWDRHAIERLRINQDVNLSHQQKVQLVNQQLEQLPEQMKQAVAPTQQLRKVNQIISNTILNSSDEHNQLAAEFGDDAAQRLVAVNQSQNHWLSKVQLFQQRSDDLKQQFNQGTSDYNQAVTQLKQQMFEAVEQKRLQVYLANPQLIKSAG